MFFDYCKQFHLFGRNNPVYNHCHLLAKTHKFDAQLIRLIFVMPLGKTTQGKLFDSLCLPTMVMLLKTENSIKVNIVITTTTSFVKSELNKVIDLSLKNLFVKISIS